MATRQSKSGNRKKRIARKVVTFDDQKFSIALIGKGRNIPKEEKIAIAGLVCLMYATDLYTLDDCLAFCHIKSDVTWYNWLDEIEEIEPLYEEAKRQKFRRYRHKLRERLLTQTERMISGYTVDVEESIMTPVTTIQPNGSSEKKITKMEVTMIRKKQVVIRPSARIIETMLFNIDGRNFTRSPEPYKAGNEEMPTEVKIEIEGEYMPPVTSEEDINQDI